MGRDIDAAAWQRACLPLKQGGLGTQTAADRADAARWAGFVGSHQATSRAFGRDATGAALAGLTTRQNLQRLENRLAKRCPSAAALKMDLDGALCQPVMQSELV